MLFRSIDNYDLLDTENRLDLELIEPLESIIENFNDTLPEDNIEQNNVEFEPIQEEIEIDFLSD